MLFAAIEGLDASGKMTQSKLLADWLRTQRERPFNKPLDVIERSFPAYETATGRVIKRHLMKEWSAAAVTSAATNYARKGAAFARTTIEVDKEADALAFQALQTANRFEALPGEVWSKPANTALVCDRYHASALVYGALDGIDVDLLDRISFGLPMPQLYILLDVDVADSLARRPERRDRYEQDLPFMERVQARYVQLFQERAALGWVIVNGRGTVDEVHQAIIQHVSDAFPLERADGAGFQKRGV